MLPELIPGLKPISLQVSLRNRNIVKYQRKVSNIGDFKKMDMLKKISGKDGLRPLNPKFLFNFN